MTRSAKAHILLVLVTLIWGATFVVIKQALAEISPLLFNAVRMTFATACLAAMFFPDLRRISRATLGAGLLTGTFLWLGYEFQTTGLKLTSASKSGFLTGISVAMVPIFMAVFFKRRANRWTVTGVLCAFIGLALMTVPASSQTIADWSSVNRGDVLTFCCAVAFAFHIIILGRATSRHPFRQIAFLQTTVASALMFITVPLIEDFYVRWTPQVLFAILITGALGTAAAFTIQAWAQQFTPPTHTALIFALEPVFAWLTSWIVLGERLGARAALGAAMILSGVLISELLGQPVESNSIAQSVS